MAKTAYWEKLRDPRWQKKRLEIMERDEFKCRMCFDGESTLNVHHRVYVKGRDPWDYSDAALVTLCEPCHEAESNVSQAIHDLLLTLSPRYGPSSDTGLLERFAEFMSKAKCGGRVSPLHEDEWMACMAAVTAIFAIYDEPTKLPIVEKLLEVFHKACGDKPDTPEAQS